MFHPPGKESPSPLPCRGEVRDACPFFVRTPNFTTLTIVHPLPPLRAVAEAVGVSRVCAWKWHKDGAPFHSAGALYDWLNRPFVRVLDDYTRPRWIAALAGVLPP